MCNGGRVESFQSELNVSCNFVGEIFIFFFFRWTRVFPGGYKTP